MRKGEGFGIQASRTWIPVPALLLATFSLSKYCSSLGLDFLIYKMKVLCYMVFKVSFNSRCLIIWNGLMGVLSERQEDEGSLSVSPILFYLIFWQKGRFD